MQQNIEHKELLIKGVLLALHKLGLKNICTLSSNNKSIIVHKPEDKEKVKTGGKLPLHQPIHIIIEDEPILDFCMDYSFPLASPSCIKDLAKRARLCAKHQECKECKKH